MRLNRSLLTFAIVCSTEPRTSSYLSIPLRVLILSFRGENRSFLGTSDSLRATYWRIGPGKMRPGFIWLKGFSASSGTIRIHRHSSTRGGFPVLYYGVETVENFVWINGICESFGSSSQAYGLLEYASNSHRTRWQHCFKQWRDTGQRTAGE